MQPLTHNSTARRMAKTILNGFRSYFADYLNSTLTAKARFEKSDLHGVRQANVERLEIYKTKIAQTDRDALEVMELSDQTKWEEIHSKFKTLVKKYHPDKNKGNKKFEDKLKKITLAYSQLKKTLGKK